VLYCCSAILLFLCWNVKLVTQCNMMQMYNIMTINCNGREVSLNDKTIYLHSRNTQLENLSENIFIVQLVKAFPFLWIP
jgi:hypothetical protein